MSNDLLRAQLHAKLDRIIAGAADNLERAIDLIDAGDLEGAREHLQTAAQVYRDDSTRVLH